MLEVKSFFDLCISENLFSPQNCKDTLKKLYDFGYRTIAINQTSNEKENADASDRPKKKKKKGENTSSATPFPFDLTNINQVKKDLNIDDLKVFNRLTIPFGNQEVLHKIIKSENYKRYDIIAVCPTTAQAFTFCCTTFEADIFTFNSENKQGFRMNRKMYNLLVERGYHFELQYSNAIEDQTKRRNLIHASHLYHTFGKSKNIIFSSGADNILHIRGPYDVISLGFIFGLNEIQSKNAVSYSCRLLMLNSVGRRHGKSVMFVENVKGENIKLGNVQEESVINLDSDEDEPVLKKSKQ